MSYHSFIKASVLLIALFALTACGQKGPLYLPSHGVEDAPSLSLRG